MMLLGISGSLRASSANTKLLHEAARLYGGDFTLGDLRLPLYDGDLEAESGVPDAVTALADHIRNAEAIVISTPEYNQSFPGVLKNALDWVSRTKDGPWRDKPVAILSAAAGRSGGARGVYALRLAMTPFRARVLPGPEVMLAGAASQFDENGRLIGESYITLLTELMEALKAEARR